MKILLLSQWFDPEPTPKGLLFAKALTERGHEVEVLTGFPNYPGGRVYPGYRIKLWQREWMEGIRVTRVALYPSHDRSAIRRAINYMSFSVSAAIIGTFLVKQPDIVFAYHPPATIAFPAIVLKMIRRVPFVLDIQDLWPDTLVATGMVKNRLALRIVGKLCSLFYRCATRIAVLSPGFKQILVERGVPDEKIEVIYNWCHESAFTQIQPDAPILREACVEGRFNVVYAGTMGRAQALSSVLHAANIVAEKDPRIQFVFVGGGIEADYLKAKAAEMSLQHVRFLPVRPAAEVGPLVASADVLLVHLRDDPLFSITIPSKTQSCLAAGRPILMAVRGDAAAVVRDAGAGICVNPEDPQAIAKAILEFLTLSPEQLDSMGTSGRAYYMENLSFSKGVALFDDLFHRAVATTSKVTE